MQSTGRETKDYDYISGNTLTSPRKHRRYADEYKEIDKREEKLRKDRKAALDKKRDAVTSIIQLASLMLILGLISINTGSRVYRSQKELIGLNRDIRVAKEEGEALRVSTLKFESIDTVQKSSARLGMKIPTKTDTINIKIAKDFFASIE